jgi:antitoxin VapB
MQSLHHSGLARLLRASRTERPNSWRVSTHLRTHEQTVVDVLPSRVFMNGNSPAVRIPVEFRLGTDRVLIRRTAEGDLIIHPCAARRGQALLEALEGFDAVFVDALQAQQRARLPVQEREIL